MKVLLQKIREILRNRKIRNRFTRVISVFAAVVVFTTTYALVLPAITMEKQAGCGIEAHQHDDSCYTDVLVCGLEESEEHHHDESCYDRILVCGKEVHVHSDTCYHKDEGNGAVAAMAAEADDPDATVRTDAEYASAADDSEEGIAKEENTGGGNSTEDNSGDNSDGNDQADESETGNGENVQAGSSASADTAVPAEYSEDAGSLPEQSGEGAGEAPTNADTAGTASAMTEDGYVPALDPLSFDQVLNSKTGIYYHHVKENGEIEEPSEITDWEKADQDTKLGKDDLLRVYLSYTIPAGLLSTTNGTARYRLPSRLHLTDEQVKIINETENSIAAQFISHKTLEITDPDNYYKYLGAEAVEGTRKPSDDKDSYLAKHGGQEYISATVRVENVDSDAHDGCPAQDLVLTFAPYSLQKNRYEYDAAGQPTKTGEKINGWITLDISTDQIDWSDPEEPASKTSDNTVSDNIIISDNKARAEGTESRENGNTGEEGIDNRERNEGGESDEKAAGAVRRERTARVIFVAEGRDDQNNRIDEISTELTLVEEIAEEGNHLSNTEDAAKDTETSEKDGSVVYKDGTLISEGTGYKITLDYKADAKIPENAYLKAAEITRESDAEAYEACLKEAGKTIPEDGKTAVDDKASRFFDIEILVNDDDQHKEQIADQDNGKPVDQGDEQSEDQEDELSAGQGSKQSAKGDSAEAAPRKIEPAAPVSVNIQLFDTEVSGNVEQYDAEQYKVIHFADEGTEEIQDVTAQTIESEHVQDSTSGSKAIGGSSEAVPPTEVQFQAESFSIYGVVYTVDFYWKVDGKVYQFSFPGGGYVSFTDLVEVLGIAGETNETQTEANENMYLDTDEADEAKGVDNTGAESHSLTLDNIVVSAAARQLVANVASIEFSNPELVDVSKVEKDTTVGRLKEERGLEVQYSAELTDEQIEKINAQNIENGDWALISMQPFVTEESLTVTMKDGDVFTIRMTDALHVDPDELVGKEVVIFDKTENRALTSDWEQNTYRTQFGSVEYFGEGTTVPESAHWTVEKYNSNYYLKSHDGKYLKIDNNNVYLVNNGHEATGLTIQKGENPDYRIYAKNDDGKILTYSDNNEYPGIFGAPGGLGGTGTTHTWLGIDYATKIPDPVGDWMLYFDDDFSEITIHVGETISLRPYKKWEWKEGNTDVQSAHWNIGGKDNNFWNQIDAGDDNGAHEAEWNDGGSGDNTAAFHWTAYVKKDTELVTHYWSVQGCATKTGVYYLTNTKNDKTIKVNVVDGAPVNRPQTVSDTVDIKVNLFDYDKNYLLDPADNNNLASNDYDSYKSISTNSMANGSMFWFLSSGSGTGKSWNNYTKGAANKGIVKNALGTDGFPALAGSGQNSQSLKYLFDTSKTYWNGGSQDGMIAYPDVNGMFQKDSDGYYYYNSNTNYFYYNSGTKETKLYEHTYTQTSSEDKGSLVNDKPIGFFPFHEYDATNNLYVNQNHALNHHVGMSMEIPFRMNENKTDENGKPIKFEFTGDDDLWVFAEWEDAQGYKHSKLILDVGGIHQPVYGYIDFTNNKSSSLSNLGLQSGVDYKLKVYYLERGGCDSNLAVRFNIPLTNIGDVPFTKRDAQTNDPLPGAVFGLYTDQSCSDTSKVRQAVSDASGYVLFNDVSIGTYYMKEISPPDGYCPSTAIYRVDVKAKNKAEITLIENGQAPRDFSYNINNEKNSTDITFAKDWKDVSGKDNTQVTYTLFQIAEPMAGGDPVYDNVYAGTCRIGGETKTGTASSPITFTVTKNSPVTVSDLPKVGTFEATPVSYSYYVLEAELEGFSPDSSTPVTSGTYTITNKPIPPSATFEDVQVEKQWEGDKADQIGGYRFKLTQERAELSTSETQGSGAFHPITIRTIDGDGTQHDTVYYVAAGKQIDITVTKKNNNAGQCTYKVGTSSNHYNNTATVTTGAPFGGYIRIFSLQNNRKWGTDWTITVRGRSSTADVSKNPKDFISRLNNLSYTPVSGFEVKVNVPTANTANVDGNSYTAVAANWKAVVQNLPYYYYDTAARKYYTYRYKVEEVAIIKSDGTELEAITNKIDGTGGESAHFTVTYNNNGSPLKITNTFKNNFELNILKVDKGAPGTPLKDATFKIRKLVETNASTIETDSTFTSESKTTGKEGTAKFEGLPAGIYELEETNLPGGYVLSGFTGKAYIKVWVDGITLLKSEPGKAPNSWRELPGDDTDADYLSVAASTLTVKNESGAALPHTGGPGTRLFTILGSILIFGAVYRIYNKKKAT